MLFQTNKKSLAPKQQSTDKNTQFKYINKTIIKEFNADNPVISVDTKNDKC
ncbi:MAG: hypothetical protein LBF22_01455 [Deltaproteobacteria bacterium]|jgi:hypothetical protein|nr:hypothetical protein [Deltaproteobacteria bacterium]